MGAFEIIHKSNATIWLHNSTGNQAWDEVSVHKRAVIPLKDQASFFQEKKFWSSFTEGIVQESWVPIAIPPVQDSDFLLFQQAESEKTSTPHTANSRIFFIIIAL